MSAINTQSEAFVIVGGGFAGLTAALTIRRFDQKSPVLLIEPRKRFIFFPLLFELFSGELNQWEVMPFYSALMKGQAIALLNEEVASINSVSQELKTSENKQISYRDLIVCTGVKSTDYGIPGVLNHAFTFRDSKDIYKLQKYINKMTKEKHGPNILFIVGAGPTGVELACKISDLLKYPIEIHLIE